MKLPHRARHLLRARGQAMVEMLVSAMFFLIPLFLAIAALGKFIDIQHTAEMSARYAAWERTVWYEDGGAFNTINNPNTKTAQAINNEIGARLMHDRSADQVIRRTDGAATSFVNGTNVMWRDAAGTDFLAQYEDLDTSVAPTSLTTDVAGAVISEVSNIGVSDMLNLLPPLPNDTLAVATINFNNVSQASEVYQRLWGMETEWAGLTFRATGAVLSNTWAANARDGTHGMVRRMVPTAQAAGEPLRRLVDSPIAPLRIWDPEPASRVQVGKITPDVLPADRLR